MEDEIQEIVKCKKNVRASLSFQMVADLLNSKKTPLYIRFKLYFGILQKKGRDLFFFNPYLAQKFGVSQYQVKYHLKKLKDDGSIIIENEGSFRRRIILTEYIIITDDELTAEMKQKQEDLRQHAFGKSRIKDHVYLSQVELMELQELMKTEYVKYITDLNNYIERTGVKYKSHFETLKAWWNKNQKAKQQKHKQVAIDELLLDYNWFEDDDEDVSSNSDLSYWYED